MDDALRRLGIRIRELRTRRGWSQEAFADIAGVHRTYMGHLERGEKNLSFLSILRVANALGVTLSELLAGLEKGDSARITNRKIAGVPAGRSKKWRRWNGACVRSRGCSGRPLLRRNTIVTSANLFRETKTKTPCNPNHQSNVFPALRRTFSCRGVSAWTSRVGSRGIGTRRQASRCARSRNTSTQPTPAYIAGLFRTTRCLAGLCSGSCPSRATAVRPN